MRLLKVEVYIERSQLPGATNISDGDLADAIINAQGVVDCYVDDNEVVIVIDTDIPGEFGEEGRLIKLSELPNRVALVKEFLKGAYGFEDADC